MTVPFSAKQQRAEQNAMTPERITALAKREDGFRVSWRYRDAWLMRRCLRLVKDRKLIKARGGRGSTTFFAAQEAPNV